MKARLFVIPGSHPSWAARLMLERKGISYSRVDLVGIVSKGVLRAAGFPGVTVPALRIDGERVQGSRPIARALDDLVPEPPLFPADPQRRAAVEAAELWGDEVLQSMARRIAWNLLSRDKRGVRSYLEGARLGVPVGLAARTAAPIVALSKRFNAADDAAVEADLAALPAALDHVDELIESGVIGGDEPNAADFQIAATLALLMTMDDLKPAIASRPAGELTERVAPGFPGHSPPGLPASWLAPLQGAPAG